MENLINETNGKLQDIITNLSGILDEYKKKLDNNAKDIENELATVQNYRLEFFKSKEKIEKMNADIEGFEEDYKKLVERFKDDELANILVAANKEISAKIDERKKQIAKDRLAMNDIVKKAEDVKGKLVKLNAEKKALELCLEKILDSHEFYSKALEKVIEYTETHQDNLCACFYDETISDMLANEAHNDDYSIDELHITKDEYVIVDKDDEVVNEVEEELTNVEIDSIEEDDDDDNTNGDPIELGDVDDDDDLTEVHEDIIEEENEEEIEETTEEVDDESEDSEEIKDDDKDNEENINIDDIHIEIALIPDDEEEDFEDEKIIIEDTDEDENDIDLDETIFEVEDIDFDEDDLSNDLDIEKVAEIVLEEIENTPVGEDLDGSILDDHSIEGNEHEVVTDNLPIQDVDLNDELDLENLINFNDELEDEEK